MERLSPKQEAQYLLLQHYWERYEQPSFVTDDVIQVPHQFNKLQDIEIAGFFTALLAWGQRITTIKNSFRLMELMDNAPHQFILQHSPNQLKALEGFVHRTFQTTDLLTLIDFLQGHYQTHQSLETAFTQFLNPNSPNIEPALIGFHQLIFANPHYPTRTKKHIATPNKNSACKRLNMYLRWMVRKNNSGVDFGLWQNIKQEQLICPIDTHVGNIASQLGLIGPGAANWQQAIALTEVLKGFSATDPVQYDFALFGLGIEQRRTGYIPQLKY